jgi:hypothetical protein
MLFISAIGSDAVHAEPVVEPLDIVDDTGIVTGCGLGGYTWWVGSRIYYGSDAGVCESVCCACATRDSRHDIHLCAIRM